MAVPGSYGYIKWKTIHPDNNGTCLIRFSSGYYNSNTSYQVLKPIKGKTDEEGWFICGRKAKTYEQRKVKFPDVSCDMCTLQLQFKTEEGIIYQCADISLISGNIQECDGMCMNGGS